MKKRLIYLLMFLSGTFAFTACSDDDDQPEIPPTVNEIAKTYTGENLKALINGEAAAPNVSVSVVTAGDNSVSLKLTNVVPTVKNYTIPNVTFAAKTKSMYVSTLTGTTTDEILGYTISAEGTVDNDILDIKITMTAIGGTITNTKNLFPLTYKGEMLIDVFETPTSSEQRVYTSQPSNQDTSYLKLDIKNFSFGDMNIGDITLDNVPVVKRGEVYGLNAENVELTLPMVGKVKVNARGGITPKADGTSTMNLNLVIDASGLTVYVTFNGDDEKESTDTSISISFAEECVAVQPDNSETSSIFKFKVWSNTPDNELILTPKVTLADKATLDSIVVKYDDGTKAVLNEVKALDFSKLTKENAVSFYVTAEDVRVQRGYFMTMEKLEEPNPVYTMETWISESNYQEPEGLATSNSAAVFFAFVGISQTPFPISKDDNAAKIITRKTVSETVPNGLVPGITAGTLFTGTFEIKDPTNPLTSTNFGLPYRKKPKNFKVTYKYTPGSTFYKTITNNDVNGAEVVEGKVDECSISAYLYEVDSYTETLDGTNIKTSNKVILKAELSDGKGKDSYTTLTIPFEETGNGSYSADKKYKLAIVCTSSAEGDQFMGGDGSALWVKHLEVSPEN